MGNDVLGGLYERVSGHMADQAAREREMKDQQAQIYWDAIKSGRLSEDQTQFAMGELRKLYGSGSKNILERLQGLIGQGLDRIPGLSDLINGGGGSDPSSPVISEEGAFGGSGSPPAALPPPPMGSAPSSGGAGSRPPAQQTGGSPLLPPPPGASGGGSPVGQGGVGDILARRGSPAPPSVLPPPPTQTPSFGNILTTAFPPEPGKAPETITTPEGVYAWDDGTQKWDIVSGPDPTSDTIETSDGVWQLNPQSGRYDIYVGPPPEGSSNDYNRQSVQGYIGDSEEVVEVFRDPRTMRYFYRGEDVTDQFRPKVTESQPGGAFSLVTDINDRIVGAWNPNTGETKSIPEMFVGGRRGPAPASELADLRAAEQSVRNLSDIRKWYKPEFIGPGRAQVLKGITYLPQGVVDLPEGYPEFVQSLSQFQNSMIKLITGAQMSEPEAARIMRQLPTGSERPDVFESKLERSIEEADRIYTRLDEMYGGQVGQPETLPASAPGARPSERVRVRAPDGRTGTIPRDQLEAAQAEGWQVVQ